MCSEGVMLLNEILRHPDDAVGGQRRVKGLAHPGFTLTHKINIDNRTSAQDGIPEGLCGWIGHVSDQKHRCVLATFLKKHRRLEAGIYVAKSVAVSNKHRVQLELHSSEERTNLNIFKLKA